MSDRKKILVVDDEPDIVKVVRKRLEESGYEVVTASDGQEGLEKARGVSPDLVILDLMLPKMDGYRVCGLLKRDARYAKIPVIIFSARGQADDIDLGKEVGADAYIMKPFDFQKLLMKIKELLER